VEALRWAASELSPLSLLCMCCVQRAGPYCDKAFVWLAPPRPDHSHSFWQCHLLPWWCRTGRTHAETTRGITAPLLRLLLRRVRLDAVTYGHCSNRHTHMGARRITLLRGLFVGALILHIGIFSLLILVQSPSKSSVQHRPVHVAVCFFGLTRSLRYTIDSIRSNILDELAIAGVRYTVFLHTHNVTRVFNPRAKEFHVRIDPSVYHLLHPDEAIIEDPMDWSKASSQELLATLLKHGDPWGEKEHISLKNLVGQLNSLQKLSALWMPQSKKYDAVIYLRSDVWFFNQLNVSQVLAAAAETTRPVIWTPKFHTFGGLNDRFAFGNTAAMKIYGNRLLYAKDFSQQRPLHSETFLAHVMNVTNVTRHTTDIVFTRVRGDGLVVELPVGRGDKLSTTEVRPVFAYRMMKTSLGYWRLRPATASS
jgi:hypothetical protein